MPLVLVDLDNTLIHRAASCWRTAIAASGDAPQQAAEILLAGL